MLLFVRFLLLYKYFFPSLKNLNNVLLFCFIIFYTLLRHIEEIKKKGKAKYTGYEANIKKRT